MRRGALLKTAADGRDPLRIEPEPVHPPDEARVLDLDAAIHDYRQAARLGDPRPFFVDHRELAPQRLGVDRHRLSRDPGQRVRRPEDIDDVNRFRDVGERGDALLPEHLLLARVHRDDAVAVAAQVEADEVARAQVIARQSDDGDGLRRVQHLLDRQRVLVAPDVERRHRAVASVVDADATRANPCPRSQIRSSTASIPTDSRIVPGPTPAARSSSSLNWRCVVLAGWMMRLFESPTLARCDHRVTPRMKSCPAARPPRQSKENTAPVPDGRYLAASGW